MGPALRDLIATLARLPGIGPRSARRIALHLLRHREAVLEPLLQALTETASSLVSCSRCGNLDQSDPCAICTDSGRDRSLICVVEGLSDVWALERIRLWRGQYHVLGGTLSALGGATPEALGLDRLLARISADQVTEVLLALSATVEGQTTAHYLSERLRPTGVSLTRLARGLPVGGALDYMDEGTLLTALNGRTSA